MFALALKFWKPIAGAVALMGLVWIIHAYAENRADKREAEIRALWEADTTKRNLAAAQAIAQAEASKAAALERNDAIEKRYQDELAAIAADRDGVLRLLQSARGQVRTLAAGQATSERGLDALAGIAAHAEEVDRRLADYDAACQRDAVRFQALQDQLRPQLGP